MLLAKCIIVRIKPCLCWTILHSPATNNRHPHAMPRKLRRNPYLENWPETFVLDKDFREKKTSRCGRDAKMERCFVAKVGGFTKTRSISGCGLIKNNARPTDWWQMLKHRMFVLCVREPNLKTDRCDLEESNTNTNTKTGVIPGSWRG